MHSPPDYGCDPPRDHVRVERLANPSVEDYLFLYNSVGRDYLWVDRKMMPADKLREILADRRVEVFSLYVGDQPAGLAELDRRQPNEIELAYFGLFPEFIGQGLGSYFLRWAIKTAWSYTPDRVWLHTCDLDHPAALPAYLKAGFRIYDRQKTQQPLPDAPCSNDDSP
jgi:GNAT superfamily N-acetyltransferase